MKRLLFSPLTLAAFATTKLADNMPTDSKDAPQEIGLHPYGFQRLTKAGFIDGK